MADTPTTRLLMRKQSLGSNTNTWGDTKLNTDLDQIDRAMVGYQAYTVTGDATLSWTNYSTTNDFEVFAVKLVGSPSAACTITVNSTQMRWKIWNACGVTVTIETAAGNGVAVRNGNIVDLICDATDVVLMTAQQGGKSSPGTGTNDIPAYSAVETAIATAIAAAALANTGQILISAVDTTSNYAASKLIAGTDMTLTNSGAGNATLTFAATPYWTAPRALSSSDSPITAVDRDVLLLTTDGAITVNLPASGRVIIADISGGAASNNITVTPPGGTTVTFGTIDTAYFASEYRLSGTVWVLGI